MGKHGAFKMLKDAQVFAVSVIWYGVVVQFVSCAKNSFCDNFNTGRLMTVYLS